MAKYQVEHQCGHGQTHDLIGRHKDRERKIEWLETTLCSDCFRAQIEVEREENAFKAAQEAREIGLPDLSGSEKQISWAQQLRAGFLAPFEAIFEEKSYYSLPAIELKREFRGHDELSRAVQSAAEKTNPDREPEAAGAQLCEAIQAVVFAFAATKTSAHWWIDNRYNLSAEFVKARRSEIAATFIAVAQGQSEGEVMEAQRRAEADKAAALALQKQAREEATIRPQNEVSPLSVEVRLEDGAVSVRTPYGLDGATALLKNLGYKWESPVWRKATTRFGDRDARAAQVVHDLLGAGFVIICQSAAIRERAIKADYVPEVTRYVTTLKEGGEHGGWFAIGWSKEDDLYAEAKSIKGARYSKPFIVVRPEMWEQVDDFAELNGCTILSPAKKLIEAQRALIADAVKVEVAPAPEPVELPPAAGKVPARLNAPETVGISADLMDDEGGA